VPGCSQTLVWYEAGYVPGYRVCMARLPGDGSEERYDMDTLTHRFELARAMGTRMTLVRVDRDEA
jgi:hypothetical protein